MAEDQSHVPDAQGPGRQHVLAALIAVKLRADHPGRSDPVLDHQAEDDGKDPRTKKQDEQSHHHDLRERADDLGDTHHDHIHLSAVIACDGAVYNTDAHVADHRNKGDQQGDPGAAPHAHPEIPAQIVGPHPEIRSVLHAGVLIIIHLNIAHFHALDRAVIDDL